MSLQTFFINATLVSHFVLIVLVLCAIFYRSFGRSLVKFVGKHSVVLSFLAALVAMVGSLIYSNVIGFTPCELCWWQRIFLYPQVVIFLVALFKKPARTTDTVQSGGDGNIFKFTVPLSIIAGLISIYHMYIQLGGTSSVLPCAAAGGACAKVYVLAYGYITIPTMALTAAFFLLLIALMHKLSKKL